MEHFVDILVKLNLVSVSYANNIEDTPLDLTNTSASASSGIGSIILFILVFAGLATLFIFVFIVMTKKNEQQLETNKSILVLDKVNLDHSGSLFVVQIRDAIHILGKTETAITPITQITDHNEIKIIKSDCLNKKEITFKSVLAEQLGATSNHINTLSKLKNNSTTSKAFKIHNKKEL